MKKLINEKIHEYTETEREVYIELKAVTFTLPSCYLPPQIRSDPLRHRSGLLPLSLSLYIFAIQCWNYSRCRTFDFWFRSVVFVRRKVLLCSGTDVRIDLSFSFQLYMFFACYCLIVAFGIIVCHFQSVATVAGSKRRAVFPVELGVSSLLLWFGFWGKLWCGGNGVCVCGREEMEFVCY